MCKLSSLNGKYSTPERKNSILRIFTVTRISRPHPDLLLIFPAAGLASIEISGRIRGNKIRPIALGESWVFCWQQDEIVDPIGLGITNTDTHFSTRILHIVRLGIGNEDFIAFNKEHPAGPYKLGPLGNIRPVLLEDLQPIVESICYK